MAAIVIREVRSAGEIEQAIALRLAVFVEEQGVTEAQEIDGLDPSARHLLASVDGKPAGTLRIRALGGGKDAKIERVAVAGPMRGQRIGHALLEAALDLLRTEGVCEVRLHAQTTAQGFYAGLGFVAAGDVFEEDGIDHVVMRLRLPPRTR